MQNHIRLNYYQIMMIYIKLEELCNKDIKLKKDIIIKNFFKYVFLRTNQIMNVSDIVRVDYLKNLRLYIIPIDMYVYLDNLVSVNLNKVNLKKYNSKIKKVENKFKNKRMI